MAEAARPGGLTRRTCFVLSALLLPGCNGVEGTSGTTHLQELVLDPFVLGGKGAGRVTWENDSGLALSVTKLTPSCPCVFLETGSNVIGAGETLEVEVTVRVDRTPGAFDHSYSLFLSDGRRLVGNVLGRVLSRPSFSPACVIMHLDADEEAYQGLSVLEVPDTEASSFAVRAVKTSSSQVEATVNPVDSESADLLVLVSGRLPSGEPSFAGRVYVQYTMGGLQGEETLELHVLRENSLRVSPGGVILKRGLGRQARIAVRHPWGADTEVQVSCDPSHAARTRYLPEEKMVLLDRVAEGAKSFRVVVRANGAERHIPVTLVE